MQTITERKPIFNTDQRTHQADDAHIWEAPSVLHSSLLYATVLLLLYPTKAAVLLSSVTPDIVTKQSKQLKV